MSASDSRTIIIDLPSNKTRSTACSSSSSSSSGTSSCSRASSSSACGTLPSSSSSDNANVITIPTLEENFEAIETIPIVKLNDITDYNLIKRLGKGGYAEVWEAKIDDRVVALKFLNANRYEEGYDNSLLMEVAMGLTLNHPHIIRYNAIIGPAMKTEVFHSRSFNLPYDKFMAGEMPKFDGDLRSLIESGAAVAQNFSKLAYQLADALVYLHSHNIIHCDIKSANILYQNCANQQEQKLVLIDFGIAVNRACYREKLDSNKYSFYYRPPELSLANVMANKSSTLAAYDNKADVWALGCVFYEMLTGEYLFPVRRIHNLAIDMEILLEINARIGFPEQTASQFTRLLYTYTHGNNRFAELKLSWQTNVLHKIEQPYRQLLEGMLAVDPDQRLNILEVRQYLSQLNINPGQQVNNCYTLQNSMVVDCLLRNKLFRRDLQFNKLAVVRGGLVNMKSFNISAEWIIDVINENNRIDRIDRIDRIYKQRFDQYFVAIQLLARMLQKNDDVSGSKLQAYVINVIIIAELLVAYNQTNIQTYLDYSDNKYTKSTILRYQEKILPLVNYDLLASTPYDIIQNYSQEYSNRAIAWAGNILVEISKTSYYFTWCNNRYVYRPLLPEHCLAFVYIIDKNSLPEMSINVDINYIEEILATIDKNLKNRDYVGMDMKKDTYLSMKAIFHQFLRQHGDSCTIRRGLYIHHNNNGISKKYFSNVNWMDYYIQQESQSLCRSNNDLESRLYFSLDDETVESLGLNSYDMIVMENCDNNCRQLLTAILSLLKSGGKLYSMLLLNLAFSHMIAAGEYADTEEYHQGRENYHKFRAGYESIRNEQSLLEREYDSAEINEQEYNERKYGIITQIANYRQKLKILREDMQLAYDRLYERYWELYSQRNQQIMARVAKYADQHADEFGYQKDNYLTIAQYPRYLIITKI